MLLVLLYAIGNPGIVVYFKTVVTGVFSLYSSETTGDGLEVGALEATEFNPFGFYINALISTMGPVIFALSILGILLAVYKPKMEAILLMIFGLAFFLALALSADPTLVYVRYVLPLTPILAIFAARLVVFIAEALAKSIPLGASTLSLLSAAVLSIAGIRGVVADNIQLTVEDSRTASRNWIEANVPDNSKILIEGFTAQSYRATTPILNSKENIQQAIEYFKQTEQPGKVKYFQFELEANVDRKRYDLKFYGDTNLETLDQYLVDGVEYIIVRPDYLLASPKYRQTGSEFLESLRSSSRLELIKTFNGLPEGGAGPTIELYKVNPSAQ